MAQERTRNRSNRNRNRNRRVPPWERPSPTLTDLSRLESFTILTHPSDSPGLGEAVDQWAGLDPEVRSYIMARVQLAQVILLDRMVRRTERLIALTASVRTGTRLTVEELRRAPKAPVYEPEEEEDEYEDEYEDAEADDDGYDDEDEDEDDALDGIVVDDGAGEVDRELAAQFAVLDAAEGNTVGGIGNDEPAPKKRRRSRKKSAKSADNGTAGPPVEVIDADGQTVTPTPEA